MKYSILLGMKDPRYCAISKIPKALANFGRPTRGASMEGSYAKPVDLEMSSVVQPKGIKVPDAIHNQLDFLIVSGRLKEILEPAINPKKVEFLPFQLINHKRRPHPEPVYVVNVLGTIACQDPARSEGTVSPFKVDQGAFFTCKRLAIDEKKVPKDAAVFRCALFPPVIFVRADVRKQIEDEKMTVRFVAPRDPL